ncbi:ImmA/IrrE family metallo-endopeptidase [Mycolicibacterium fluoranthenivorans]|uniref:ImmA/IrrE family metallo-endopeptidase n=1 Tax=Mycolicibacterium fluoranthenivorans TaxID=258505 RepID=A0A7G8PAS8_9MYCO|nr:XRE family transcriptional regulator [Mycolicibacterium fluoranthenivorans]QNJ91444.1 ImmA/IrrE family metallo-endopeptidase [Mycolicibacterium fluoranthenivorans]
MEFAERIGIANGSVSKIENGRMAITDELVESISSVFDCTPAFLVGPDRLGPTTRPWLRAYADASKKAVDQQTADCTTALEVIDILALRQIPDTIPVFDGDLSDEDSIEQFATDVRIAAGLGDGEVVGNSIRAAERLGCLVLPMREELGRHLGLSVRANQTPVLCVARSNGAQGIPGDRQRFTVAHEIGHLGLHAGLGPPESADDAARYEKQAHRFAGAFLAPGDELLDDLREEGNRVTLRALSALKRQWGISIKALVMRFRGMGVIDEDHARSLYKQISARGWNKSEPVEVGGEEAIWFKKAIGQAHRGAPNSLRAAADSAGVGVSYLNRWTAWVGTADATGDVIQLGDRVAQRATGLSEERRGGSVRPMPLRKTH